MTTLTCRICAEPLEHVLIDLGVSPLANSYVAADQLDQGETFFPLKVHVCGNCKLAQLQEFATPEHIFTDYAYFSSFSNAWLEHSRKYVGMMTRRLSLTSSSKVVEVASNDGYLLQYFCQKSIPVLGIEPAVNVAAAAEARGVPTRAIFFGRETSAQLVAEGHSADLVLGNNVYAHVPDLHSFTAGLKTILKPKGVITLEFPHLLRLIAQSQFDTIYHEHFSYLSLLATERIFADHGLAVFDVDQLPTHGGSLRVYGKHTGDDTKPETPALASVRAQECEAGMDRLEGYNSLHRDALRVKCDLLEFLIQQKRGNKLVAGYGAPAKGNTLLNYCGVGPDLIAFTVDRNPAKQNHYLPGCRIPVFGPEHIAATKPDFVVILPWNLRDEISQEMAQIRSWGGQFVVPIPTLEVF